MPDLISIITPVFNRAELVTKTIESVLVQTHENWELIIVDDGSTDHTSIVVRQYQKRDHRIKYFHQEKRGTAAARNNGISKADGKYLAFLDSDDRYYPNALTDLVQAIRDTDTQIKLIYGDFNIFFEATGTYKFIKATPPMPRPKLYFQFLLAGANPVAPCACIVEKQAIVELGMFDETFLNREDVELWTRLVQKYDVAKVDALLSCYRVHQYRQTSDLGMARYDRDRLAFRFFNDLSVNKLFPDARNDRQRAARLERLARTMLNPANLKVPTTKRLVCFDTGLHILRTAQKYKFETRREQFIRSVEKHTPHLLEKHFDSTLRI